MRNFFWTYLILNSIELHVKVLEFVDNNAKGQISKQREQENKARQIFRKTNVSYTLIRTRVRISG